MSFRTFVADEWPCAFEVKLLLYPKSKLLIVVTLVGVMMVVKPEHSPKASSLISVTELGMDKQPVKPLQ